MQIANAEWVRLRDFKDIGIMEMHNLRYKEKIINKVEEYISRKVYSK